MPRKEKDSLGVVEIPDDALHGPQTQRAIDNFPISGRTMPEPFLRALLAIKRAAAQSNGTLQTLQTDVAAAIVDAVDELLADPRFARHFPVDVYQTGSGTSSNMNANEVIAHLASRSGTPVHPNDHVNFGQSSNDVIPSAIHASARVTLSEALLPSLDELIASIRNRADEYGDVVKTGRTHLMDAMPVRLDQCLGAWAAQLEDARDRLRQSGDTLAELAVGGTAVGTGVNTHPDFASGVAARLGEFLGTTFRASANPFPLMSSQDRVVALSGDLKTLAVALTKIANDLRWMNSGPLAGFGEIALPALQPGSSIMPGKVNPVIPEAVAMVCAQVIGNDATIMMGGQSGNFQLNVMLPVVAYNLIQSIEILASASTVLADKAIAGFTVNEENIQRALGRNPILVTALNPVIGYELGAAVAKKAYAEGRAVKDVAKEMTDLTDEELDRLLDPAALTEGGIKH